MKKLTILLCIASVNLIQGCTVLGFAVDAALHLRVDELNQGRHSSDPLYVEPSYFTNKGLEQDIKVISELLQDMNRAQQTTAVDSQAETTLFSVNYANKELCKKADSGMGECYDADYYQQFYIKEETEQSKPVAAIQAQ